MVSFQERKHGGSKVCVLNLEAFSVFVSQNSDNDEVIKKLFEDIIQMNEILAGSNPNET